jgi:ABC-type lipoprotein export system ATPase subunit
MNVVLALRDITVTFNGNRAALHTAARNTALMMKRGEFAPVVCSTGCCESTLLNIAVALLSPTRSVQKLTR